MKNPKNLPSFFFLKKYIRSSSRRLINSAAARLAVEDHHVCFNPETMPLHSAVEFTESADRQRLTKQDFAILIRRCTASRSLDLGKRLHQQMVRKGFFKNRFLCNLLINLYTKCDCFQDASDVFDEIRERNHFSWTMMLAAFSQHGHFPKTILFFRGMLLEGMNPGEVGISIFISACTDAGAIAHGKALELWIQHTGLETEFIVQTALVSMYGKLGFAKEAESVFGKMTQIDVVAWSAMIAAFARNGQPQEALELFRKMDLDGIHPNSVTFVSGLDACASLAALAPGRLMHRRVVAEGIESGVIIGTALLNLYGKCGQVDSAVEIFDQMPERNVVTWSALSAAFAQNGRGKEAIAVLHRMDLEGMQPNGMTFVSVLDACAGIAALKTGRKLHARIESLQDGTESDVFVLTALVNMYSKCGSLDLAGDLFSKTSPQMDLVLWNSLVATNAQHGESRRALQLFLQMLLEGLNPTAITFTSVLFACSHAGMLKQGRDHFLAFVGDHRVSPEAEHYGCLVDLLGRAGWIQDAADLLDSMPFEPHVVAWMSFLGACRTYKDMRRAAWAAERVFALDPKKRAPYVLLSNMYAKAGRWDDVAKMRKAMQESMAVKEAGKSWIEVKDRVHEFVCGDLSHPRIGEIHDELQRLMKLMREAGYVPDTEMVLHDVGGDVKEIMVGYHSEKLAIAFALITTRGGNDAIHVVKNLRVCSDCHSAAKIISSVVSREIIVRDSNRFHRFVNGACSCGDYW